MPATESLKGISAFPQRSVFLLSRVTMRERKKGEQRKHEAGANSSSRSSASHRDCLSFSSQRSIDYSTKSSSQITEAGLLIAPPDRVLITPPIPSNLTSV
jgi:hypothetical protein